MDSKQKPNNENNAIKKKIDLNDNLMTTNLSPIAIKRLMREYQICHEMSKNVEALFSFELVDNSLANWNIYIHHVDIDSQLQKDMCKMDIPYILLNAQFPHDFPFHPPFLRVVKPGIEGGYVMHGGAICMELLTTQGWSSVYTVEAMIMQFISQVVKGRGRISKSNLKTYSLHDAKITFKKISNSHDVNGWHTPALEEG